MHSEDKKWENGKSTSDLYKRKKGSEGIEDKNFHDRRTKLKAKASGRISSERKKKKSEVQRSVMQEKFRRKLY